ncbi:HNH endonuclease [Ancylothrix sp. C2]|uniref:HNH endonuclease signature motif containing protein n=1 Tax=Ancylothrix sp. D3o TaxID=2953691 RepID=UPI0021BACFE0|nr:HNH endonuclease signature motif containing protein [Ancylothrix sp. D3o]MCT7951987.1 HNH endonuclease [Ancylothrix sp. D3o]
MSAKREISGKCQQCGVSIHRKYVYCAECRQAREFGNRTLSDVICKTNKASKYCRVREHARKLYQNIGTCEVCGYNKHVEICHIQALKDFDVSALVGEVNHRSNIAVLCPNCHWELDNGLLNL